MKSYTITIGETWYCRVFYSVEAESEEEAEEKFDTGQAKYIGHKVDECEKNGFVECEEG
jgi:hypothetical protein